MSFWHKFFGNKIFGKSAVRIRCGKCDTIYTVGLDAICITDDDAMEWLTGGGATIVGNLSSKIPMIAKASPDHESIQSDKKTILRLAPKHGWQCQSCNEKNSWQPIEPPVKTRSAAIWQVWFKHKEEAEQYATDEFKLFMILGMAPGITDKKRMDILDAFNKRRYQINPAKNGDESGFNLIFFGP